MRLRAIAAPEKYRPALMRPYTSAQRRSRNAEMPPLLLCMRAGTAAAGVLGRGVRVKGSDAPAKGPHSYVAPESQLCRLEVLTGNASEAGTP